MAAGDYIHTIGFGSGEAQDIVLLGFYYEGVNVYVEGEGRRLKEPAEDRILEVYDEWQ